MNGPDLGRYRLAPGQEAVPGVVLRAEDTLLERRVGLLLVPAATVADPERLERVRHEVERAAAFVHPGAAATYGLEEGGGRQFVTLEPMAGSRLEAVLAGPRPSRRRAVEMALALCDVLASAKEEGIVHGSLSPADVTLGDDGSVTVGGFGLRELRLSLDREGGGPSPDAAWRAPETAAGLLPDHRADLFALARIVRRMLAAPAAGQEPAEPPVSDLEAVLDRCLSEDPARRPGSVADLRAPLEEALRELVREPEPEAAPEEAPSWRRFSPAGRWGALAAAALLLVLALWALSRTSGREETAAGRSAPAPGAARVDLVDLAVLPFAGGEGESERLLARGFGREVNRLLASDRRVSVVDAGSAARAAALEGGFAPSAEGTPEETPAEAAARAAAARRRAAARLGVAHLLQGSFLWQRDGEMSRAEVTVRLTRVSDDEVLWQETLEAFFNEVAGLQGRVAAMVRGRLGGGRGRQPPSLTPSAAAYEAYLAALGRSADAKTVEHLRVAADGFETAAVIDPMLLLAHTGRVAVQLELVAAGAGDAPLAAARQALAAARSIDAGHPEVGRAAGRLELVGGGDPSAARRALEAARERLPGDPDLLRSIAWIDRREGRWDEAIAGLESARRRAPLDPALAADLVRAQTWKRRFADAASEVERLGSVLPGVAEASLLEADLLLRHRGETASARAALEGMPEPARSDPGWQRRMLRLDVYEGRYRSALDRLPRLGLAPTEELVERAWIHRHMGEARRSAALFERARDLLDDRLEADPGNPWLSSLLAQAYAGTGGAHLAARMGQRAVAQLPVTVDAVAGAELVERLARTYVLAGDHEHALDELAFLLEVPSPVTVATLRLDPAWRPLRQDPRFRDLLERFAG